MKNTETNESVKKVKNRQKNLQINENDKKKSKRNRHTLLGWLTARMGGI
jgi:hypothetical protein